MEQFLEKPKEPLFARVVRFTKSIVKTCFIIAGIVALAADLGLSDEISLHRIWIWLAILIIALAISLCRGIVNCYSTAKVGRQEIIKMKAELQAAKDQSKNIFDLMEARERTAPDRLMSDLRLVTDAIENKEAWKQHDARIDYFDISEHSEADELDPAYASRDRLKMVINIGAIDSVRQGMKFRVNDCTAGKRLGIIAVQSVTDNGAECVLLEPTHAGFWTAALTQAENGTAGMLQPMPNCITPLLPPSMESAPSQAAADFAKLIEGLEQPPGAIS